MNDQPNYKPKPGNGTLFQYDKKDNPNRPDWKGHVIAHRDITSGERLDVAGWNKKTRNGNDLISIKMSDVFAGDPSKLNIEEQKTPPLDDEVPF
mgnify:FL=1